MINIAAGIFARDRRGRRAEAHAMPHTQRVKSTEVVHQPNKPRHAAPRQTRRAQLPRARPAVSAIRQRVSDTLHPARSSELADTVVALDVPVWQVMLRATQSMAFGAAVMVGLVLAWLGAAATSYLDGAHNVPHSAPGSPADDPAIAAPPSGKTGRNSDAMPKIYDGVPKNMDIDPEVFAKLEAVSAELDEIETLRHGVSQPLLPVPSCEPTCPPLSPPEHPPGPDAPLESRQESFSPPAPLPELADAPGPQPELNAPPAAATVEPSIPRRAEQIPDAPSP